MFDMIAPPIYHAAPPEVHSTLLSTGATPAGIAAAGVSWTQLAATYSAALAELESVLMTVQADYQGPSAEQFVAAHMPMLMWLGFVVAKALEAAAAHADIAAAYETALVTMPTMFELMDNHATEAALVMSNFMGVNTVPIALTQADYIRMWILAGDVMIGWDSASTSLVDAIVETPTSPITMVPGVGEAGNVAATAAGFGTHIAAQGGGAALNGADLIGTKLGVGKLASSPASILNRLPGVYSSETGAAQEAADEATTLDEGLAPTENMASGAMQQVSSMASSAPQALMSAAQGPSQMLMSAPQQLASAPQQLSSMLGQFLGSAGSDLGQQSAMPIGFAGTSSISGFNPAGMTSLAGGALGSGPARPMLPSTWGTPLTSAAETPGNGLRAMSPATPGAAGNGTSSGGGMMGHGARNKRDRARQVNTYTDDESGVDADSDGGAYVMTR